jgi:tetratricopeptide (TPR) repeat protein
LARRNQGKLAVAGLILCFLLLLGAGGGWVAFDRAARRAKASQDLELALQRAELYLEQGKRASARAGLDQAERIAPEAQPDPARNQRLAGLRERLEAEERDQQFIDRFEEIRLRVQSQVDVQTSSFTDEAALPEIREALRQYGIVIGDRAPAEAGARVRGRPEPVRQSLIAAFDECLLQIALTKGDLQTRDWLLAAEAAADNDAWRLGVRKAIVDLDWKALEALAREADVRKQQPSFLILVGISLPLDMKSTRLELFRRIQRAYPADLWANLDLAMVLVLSGRHGEAIRYFTAALALRPDNPGIYLNRGTCFVVLKETDAAIADYERCLDLAPNYFAAFRGLSHVLKQQGRLQDALAVCHKAVEACPDRAEAWCDRANFLLELDEFHKAIADSTRAIQLDAKLAAAWAARGEAYRKVEQYDKAIADCSKAIELNEKYALGWSTRGNSYLQLRQYEKALTDCSRAIQLDPTRQFAWYTRGNAYQALGDHKNALADCLKAVELAPKDPWTHGNLGDVLLELDRAQDASAAYRKAIAIDKEMAVFHGGLAGALEKQGEFREGLVEMRRAHELGSKHRNWSYPSAQWVRRFERLVDLDERLPAFLSGKTQPASPEERIELAEICARKHLNRAAARFYDEAFTPLSSRTPPCSRHTATRPPASRRWRAAARAWMPTSSRMRSVAACASRR